MGPAESEFTVGWICALPLELAAAQGMLEEEYGASEIQNHHRDSNTYCLGRIARHKIVLTCLISTGNNQAGSAALHMYNTFEKLRFILMVGIGGGIPSPNTGGDVRLGDVVVSMPSGDYGGVIQYDSGKFLQDKGFFRTGALQPPPKHLQSVVRYLTARHESEDNCITKHVNEMLQKKPRNHTRAGTGYRRPGRGHDLLFKAEYIHQGNGDTCVNCDKNQLVARHERLEDEPVMHYGNIASGSSVVRDALKRDQLGKDYSALCVEMEAAGLMDESECLVIRGICDYSDSHKNKEWQRYAAAAAAAYAKELLGAVSRPHAGAVQNTPPTDSGPFGPMDNVRTGLAADVEPSVPSSPPIEAGPSTPSPLRRTASPTAPASQYAGSTRSLSIVPSRTWPSSNVSFKPDPLSPLQFVQSTGGFPLGQPLDQQPLSLSSKAPLRSLAESAWEGREGEYILVEARLEWYRSCGPRSQDPDEMRQCDFKIFELMNDRYNIPTRRITIRSCEREEQDISYWMPLDNIHVETKDQRVQILWSDCSHLVEATRNARTTFTCRYTPENCNRTLDLDFENASDVQRVVDVLLHPTLEKSHYDQNDIVMGSSKVGTLSVYNHRTGGEASNLCADQHPKFAILISSSTADSSRSSKLFFDRPYLDFELDEVHEQLLFKNMGCLDYSSSFWKSSEKDFLKHLDPEGRPDKWDWATEDLELSLINYEDLTVASLMEVLTGWRLLFSEVAPSVIQGRFPNQRKMGRARVTVWEREAETGSYLQLLVRAPSTSGKSRDTTWLSASLTSPAVGLTIPKVGTIDVKVQTCLRGAKISIHQMSVDASNASEHKALNIRLQFHESTHANNFYDACRLTDQPLRRPTTVGAGFSGRQRDRVLSIPSRAMSTDI